MGQSEKNIEKTLKAEVENKRGWCLKLLSTHITGLPDRLCLLPIRIAFFVELKSEGKKPKKIQTFMHNRLRALGFGVHVIDKVEQIKPLIESYEND